MKKVNRDYISVVRNVGGRLQYEKIPVVKSAKAVAKLEKMCEEDDYTIDDMEAYLYELPAFRFLVLPYYNIRGSVCYDEPEDWKLEELARQVKDARTKVKFYEKAVELIEEWDYRWNVIRITNSLSDILIRSHADYESTYLDIQINKDMSVVFESNDLGASFGNLYYTIYKNNTPILPYRSVVELYECSDDVIDATKVFDPEDGQWDNALRSFTSTVNAIITDQDEFLKIHVVEAGGEMLEKIKLMCLDTEAYYHWLLKNENVSIDYSECDRTLDSLDSMDDANRRLHELYSMGNKMSQALILAENLLLWADEGLVYKGLDNVYGDLTSMAKALLQEMESKRDELPGEVFAEEYGESDLIEKECHDAAEKLRSACNKLRMLLSLEQRNPDMKNE